MLHEPASSGGTDPAAAFKMRLGMWMFALYCLFYGSFVYVNLASPLSMEKVVLAGLNLATVFGFALIVFALVQALIYDAACRARERQLAGAPEEGGDS